MWLVFPWPLFSKDWSPFIQSIYRLARQHAVVEDKDQYDSREALSLGGLLTDTVAYFTNLCHDEIIVVVYLLLNNATASMLVVESRARLKAAQLREGCIAHKSRGHEWPAWVRWCHF